MTAKGTRLPPKAKRFYEEALTRAERFDFPVALDVEGVDQEIAVLRLRLRTVVKDHPQDLQLMVHGITLLVRALAARYHLPKADENELSAWAAETARRLKERAVQGTEDE